MDWLTILLLWIVAGLIIAMIYLHTLLRRAEDHLYHVDAIAEMSFTALEAHLKGQHVELHHLTEDGTPIRETETEE